MTLEPGYPGETNQLRAQLTGEVLQEAANDMLAALGDWDRLPDDVRDRLYQLLHDWRTR